MFILGIELNNYGNLYLRVKENGDMYNSDKYTNIYKINDNIALTNKLLENNSKLIKFTDFKYYKKYKLILNYLNDNNNIKLNLQESQNHKIINWTIPYINYYNRNIKLINNFECIVLNPDEIIYKGMKLEMYDKSINIPTWYSNKLVADKYSSQRNNYNTFKFKIIKKIKLLILNKYNIKLIVKHIINKISKLNGNYDGIKQYINDLYILKVTTGYNMSYKEQLDCLRNFKNSRINYKLNRKKKWKYNYNNIRLNINGEIYSHLKEDLNRISITTNLDRKMASIICNNCNDIDGYYNWYVPSLWEFGEFGNNNMILDEEICLCKYKDSLKMI